MSTLEFVDYVLSEYSKNVNRPVSETDRVNFYDYATESFSGAQLGAPVTKKLAALILHRFMTYVMKLKDVDWAGASVLRDVYECRVCANAVAQCYARGVIPALAPALFGLSEVPSDTELSEYVQRLLEQT